MLYVASSGADVKLWFSVVGMQSVLQAYIMKNIIFDQRPKDMKSVPIEQ